MATISIDEYSALVRELKEETLESIAKGLRELLSSEFRLDLFGPEVSEAEVIEVFTKVNNIFKNGVELKAGNLKELITGLPRNALLSHYKKHYLEAILFYEDIFKDENRACKNTIVEERYKKELSDCKSCLENADKKTDDELLNDFVKNPILTVSLIEKNAKKNNDGKYETYFKLSDLGQTYVGLFINDKASVKDALQYLLHFGSLVKSGQLTKEQIEKDVELILKEK